MMIPIFFPHNMGSAGSRHLARRMGNTRRVYPDRNYRHRRNHVVINWGNSTLPRWYVPHRKWFNHPEFVSRAVNKITAFQRFDACGVPAPFWTKDANVLTQIWNENPDAIFLARSSVTGHGGRGISVLEKGDEITPAPLYTRHLRHKDEYRVHVAFGKVIDFQKKKKRRETEVDYLIRSWANGWVFCREGVTLPDEVAEIAVRAVRCLGLDFGGVDVAHRVKENRAYVLEINTAPGIEGTTLLSYQWAFEDALRSM